MIWPISKFCHFLFVQRFKFLKMFQINVSKKSVWGKRKHQILIEKFKVKFTSSGRRCAGQKGKIAFVSFTKWSEVHGSYGIADLQKAHTLQNQSFYEVEKVFRATGAMVNFEGKEGQDGGWERFNDRFASRKGTVTETVMWTNIKPLYQ